jgi:hypothetical protein
MKSIAGRGWVSRAYVVILAVFAVSLAVLLVNARPAQAVGENWYGTVEYQGTGAPVSASGYQNVEGLFYNNNHYRYEVPVAGQDGTVYARINERWVYPDQVQCHLAEERLYGSASGTGEIFNVGTPDADGVYSISVYPTGNWGSTWVTHEYRWEGLLSDGSRCDSTNTYYEGHHTNFYIRSKQNPSRYDRIGTNTFLRTNSQGCTAGVSECSDGGLGEARVHWNLKANECTGYSKVWNIGNGDRLFRFNPCQTKAVNARISVLDDLAGEPRVCDFNFVNVSDSDALNLAEKVVNKLNKACAVYKAVRSVEWAAQRFHFWHDSYMTEHWRSTCGLWVVDEASWRPPKIRPAVDADTGLNVSGIGVGSTRNIKTSTGSIPVTC